MSEPIDPTERVLVLTPTGRDAQLVAAALGIQFQVVICPRPEDLLPELAEGVGALLIAEEALTPPLVRELVAGLDQQGPWSNVPFVVLAGKPSAPNLPDWASRDVLAQLEPLGNVTVLERPVRIRTLVGVIKVALESRRRQLQMRALHENVQTLNRGKDEFLAMLGHELRNPLAAIRTALAVLPQAKDDEVRFERYLAILERQSLAMKRMLDDLLDVSRVSIGKVRLEVEEVELTELARQTVEALAPVARGQGQTLTFEATVSRLPVRGDPVRLEQVITNVVGNALKYTPPGGRIAVVLERVEAEAVFRVKDDGIGLEPEMISKVFELFTQARVGLDRAQGGLGVGLALVDGLVKAHGGHVTAHSEGLGKGAEFRVRLPLSDHRDSPGPDRSSSAPEGDGLRVVVVDDNADLRETLHDILQQRGHEVTAAATGTSALDLARAATPDVMIIDIGLPQLDGYEVARRVRAAASAGNPHLVALTGYGSPEAQRRSREAGFDDHLLKPVVLEQLDQVLARVAERLKRSRKREPREGSTFRSWR
jgi:signal transduction histidine kinase/ActR/RegA family two-component response regulator